MLALDRGRGVRQRKIGVHEAARDVAGAFVSRQRGSGEAGQYRGAHACDQGPHASPPARSAFGVACRGAFFPSMFLYHDISAAVATITTIPNTLIATCMAMPSDISTMAKCPTNARNTPKQKISSECCPHRIAGRITGHVSGAQSRGTYRNVRIASATKCAKRRTSRLVLSIGYIHSENHLGT